MTYGILDRSTLGAGITAAAMLVLASVASATVYNDAVLADNPVYYWTFDEAGGNALNQGTLGSGGGANDLVLGAAAGRTASTSSGGGVNLGNAFNGVNAAGTTGMALSGSTLTGGNFSKYAVEMWINYDGSPQSYLLDNFTNQPALISSFVGTQFELFGGGSRTSSVGTGPSLPVGTFAHVVVGVDSTSPTHDIYVNGALAGTFAGYGRDWVNSQINLNGTAFGGGLQDSNSDYDELAIYNLSSVASGGAFSAAVADIASHFSVDSVPETFEVATSYTYNPAGLQPFPAADRNDPGLSKLNDGVIGSTAFNDGTWVGVQDPGADDGIGHPLVDFDLGGQSVLLDKVQIAYMVDTQFGIHAPDSVEVLVSDDGVNFASLLTDSGFVNVDINGAGGVGTVRSLSIDLQGASAQFVRLDFRNDGEWSWLGEVTFTAQNAIPEPASMMLLLAALPALMRRRRGADVVVDDCCA